jgi:hypothetical protein
VSTWTPSWSPRPSGLMEALDTSSTDHVLLEGRRSASSTARASPGTRECAELIAVDECVRCGSRVDSEVGWSAAAVSTRMRHSVSLGHQIDYVADAAIEVACAASTAMRRAAW